MSDYYLGKIKGRWMATNAGTNAGVSATKAGATGRKHVVLHAAASGDAAALVTIESPAGTVKWRKRFSAAFTMSENFAPGMIECADGDDVLCKVSASTSNSESNIGGVSI